AGRRRFPSLLYPPTESGWRTHSRDAKPPSSGRIQDNVRAVMVGSKPEGKSDCLRATRARFCLPLFLLLALCWGCGRPPEAGLEVIADFDTIGWAHDVIPAADGIYV